MGSVTVNTSIKKYGDSSLLFNGGYLIIPHNSLLDINNTRSWTLEWFININGRTMPSVPVLWNKGTSGVNGVRIYNNASGFVELAGLGGAASVLYAQYGASTSENWVHTAICYDKQSNTLRVFKNGVLVTSRTDCPNYSNTRNLFLAYNTEGGAGGWNFNGYIDCLRFTNNAARYVTNFDFENDTYFNI